MSIIELILPKTAVPRKRPQSYLITSLYQGTLYHYCSKFQTLCAAVFTPLDIINVSSSKEVLSRISLRTVVGSIL